MPLPAEMTDYQKKWALTQAGYDPAKYALDENGYVNPVNTQQPTISSDSNIPNKPSPMPDGNDSGYNPLQTAGMSLAQAAPSAIGSGLGAGGAAALASWALGPEVGLPATIVAMLGGGLAGGGVTKAVQNAIEPSSWQSAVQQASSENPKSAIAGQLASIPLGGFNPSPSGLVRGLGAGAKVLTGMDATAPEMDALKNLLFNTGLGAAQPTLNYATGQAPAPTVASTLEGAGTGALFNKPNAIGNALGFGGNEVQENAPSKEQLLAALQAQQQQQAVQPTPDANTLAAGYGLPTSRQEIVSGSLANVAARSDKMSGYKSTPEAPDISTFEGEGGSIPDTVNKAEELKAQDNEKLLDFQKARSEIQNEQIRRAIIQRDAMKKSNDALQQTVDTTPGQFIGHDLSGLQLGNNLSRPETMPAGSVDFTVATSEGNKSASLGLNDKELPTVGEDESAQDLAARQKEAELNNELPPKYQEESAFPTKTVPADHLSVKEAIDEMQAHTDDASITEENANEAHKALKLQVDWSSMPAVGKQLSEPNFDPLDPVAWEKVQDEYNKYLNAPKAQVAPKQDIIPEIKTPAPQKIQQVKQKVEQAKNPPITGSKALQAITGTKPKPLDETSLQPKPAERISPKASEGLSQIWKEIDSGNGRAAMNRIEYAYNDANPDTRSVLHAQMHVLKTKHGIEPSEQFNIDNPKYQDEPTFKSEVSKKLTDEGIPTTNVKEWNKIISDWAKPRFGIEIHEDGSITNKDTGKPVAGAAYLRNSLRDAFIKINPDKAGIDTLPHELHHVFMDYLERFGSSSDKKLIQSAYDKVQQTPEFQKAKVDNPNLDPNEYLASRGGLEFINRQLGLDGNGYWKQFYKDYMSHLKTKFTKTGTLDDYSNLLNYRMIHSPLHKGSAFNGLNTATKNQDESQTKISQHEQDVEDYRTLDNKRNSMLKDDSAFLPDRSNFTPEFKDLWQKLEDIKNRNGGMPPKSSDKFQDEPEIRKQGNEGRTPYPFTLKELNRGDNVLNEVHDTDLAGKGGELFHIDEPSINTKNQDKSDLIKYAEDSNQPEIINQERREDKYRQISLTKSQLDKATDLAEKAGAGKEGNEFNDAIRSIYPLKDQTQAKYMNPIVKTSKGISKDGINRVEDVLLRENSDKQDYSSELTGKEKALHDTIRDSYNQKQQDQIAANQPVTDYKADGTPFMRLPEIDPYYHVNKISPKVAETLTEGSLADKNKLKQDFLDHQKQNDVNDDAAKSKLNSILTAYDSGKPNLARFAADRKAQGVGLPDSWMRKGDLMRTLNSYYNRVASDRSWHDTIETNPDVAKSLGLVNDPWGKPYESEAQDISHIPEVRDITDKLTGEAFHKDEAVLKGVNRVASSLMLGPLTNVHIAAGSAANSINYIHPGELIPAFTSAVKNLSKNWETVYETGYHKKDFTGIKDLINTNMTGLEKLNSLSSAISDLSGRQGMNHFTKSLLQGIGEYVIKNRALEANNGNEQAINLMKQVDPDWSAGKVYTGKSLDNVASTFASYIHGAHDTRTLPGYMLKDNIIQPFLSLASWNVAQTNAWMKHVWTPATTGNFTPLIMSTLGSVLGGYVVKQMREGIADKKSPIPSLSELMASDKGLEGNIPLTAYNLMAMSSYTGYAGILSVAAKAGQDIAFKNIPQGAAFPLDELISNPVQRVSQFLSAMYNDPNFDYLKAGTKLSTDLVRENFQLGRILENWTSDKTDLLGENAHYEKNVNDALGDLRRFKMAEGMPYDEQTPSDSNPYTDRTLKEFKRTQDIGEAAQDLPSLIDTAFTKANGSVEVLKQQLSKIKQNNFETMPSPSDIPRTFLTYLNYLADTQGQDAASQRLTDYLTQEGFNKAKASMVPKF